MLKLSSKPLIRKWNFILCFLFFQIVSFGIQSAPLVPEVLKCSYIEVSGIVRDMKTGESLPGVNVLVKGSTIGTVTDFDGNYSITVPNPNDVLIFSYIGFISQEIPVNNQLVINVELQEDLNFLDEVVITGYSSERVLDLTGAVSILDTEALENRATNNPIQSLQGQISGVFVTTNGNPSGNATVRIRGVSTLNNNDPLYVIDGVPTKYSSFEVLNPNDIESIQVLKDASSSAIYGARASNGVIIVTTKQSKMEKLQFNYNSSFTYSLYSSKDKALNTRQRAMVQWQATINDGLDPDDIPIVDFDWVRNTDGTAILNQVIIPEYIVDGLPSSDTDWFDEISRNGLIQEHNLSFSSGGERGGAFLSLRYFDNEYLLKYRDFNKLSARINSHYNFLEGKIKIGQNLVVSNGVDNGFDGTEPVARALEVRPILPVRTESGEYSGPVSGDFVDSRNPVMILDYNQWDKRSKVNIFGNLYTNMTILENLTFNTNFGIDGSYYHNRDIERRFTTGFISQPTNYIRNTKSEIFNWNLNSTLQYSLTKDNYNASVLIGSEATENNFSENFSYREDFAIETLDYFVEDSGTGRQVVGGNSTGSSLLSFFGKLNYSYNDKYLLSATVRYDGSSRFDRNNRFGAFPSFSGGWRMSEEGFIKNNLSGISDLKIRASWGKVGNQEISDIARYTLYRSHYGEARNAFNSDNGTAYDIAGAGSGPLQSGFRRTQSGNNNLKWEETTEFNLGLDYGIFNNNLIGSFDYFKRNTSDILISPAYLAVRGEGGNQFVNGASVEVTGFEMFVKYRKQWGDLSFSVAGNISHYNDHITKLPANVVRSYPGNIEKTILGKSMNSWFGYVTDGLFQNDQEVNQHAEQPGKGIGRIRYKDLNEDGVINSLDQDYLGKSAPKYEYGINLESDYKGFDLKLFFQGVQGVTAYNSAKRRTDFTSLWAGTNYGTRTLNAWTPSNMGSNIPAVTLTDTNNEGRLSTYFLDNGSYLKLRLASIGYSFENLIGESRTRIFMSGENLLTFKDNSGKNAFTSADPEVPNQSYPRPLNLTIGVNVSF
ncbi:TonB-dependent receptor [Arenibacter palladensis]|uniref:SusC/RagA family TonB-linked outer membrane protein n=1 Tax=Arenibacter palladensis TaxID=237373 RepID=UPI002FD29D24